MRNSRNNILSTIFINFKRFVIYQKLVRFHIQKKKFNRNQSQKHISTKLLSMGEKILLRNYCLQTNFFMREKERRRMKNNFVILCFAEVSKKWKKRKTFQTLFNFHHFHRSLVFVFVLLQHHHSRELNIEVVQIFHYFLDVNRHAFKIGIKIFVIHQFFPLKLFKSLTEILVISRIKTLSADSHSKSTSDVLSYHSVVVVRFYPPSPFLRLWWQQAVEQWW